MFLRQVIIIAALFVNFHAQASLDLGIGPISSYSGRLVNGANVAWNSSNFTLSVQSTGVQTHLYYDSSYYVALTWPSVSNEFWWGALRGNFGIGSFYSERGYRETATSSLEKASDFVLGPSIRIVWDILGPMYLSFEGMYGLRNPVAHLALSFQDVEMIAIGFHL